MRLTKLLAGVLVLIFVFSGFVSARPQADVEGWTAVDLFVKEQIDTAHAKGTINDPHFVEGLTDLVLKRFGRGLDSEIAEHAKNLTPEQRETLKRLLVSDYVSYLYQKSFYPKNAKVLVVKPVKVSSVKVNGKVYDYYYAPMSSSIPYPIHWWVQVKDDLDGGHGKDGHGNYYWIDGNNNISYINVIYTSSNVVYEIHFYDEDDPDPVMDEYYDWQRCRNYPGRDDTYGCEDIEAIEVSSGDIIFHSDWSHICDDGICVDQTFADDPAHAVGRRPYDEDVVIYVSNVMNHMMDTIDSNPEMDKNWGYTSWT